MAGLYSRERVEFHAVSNQKDGSDVRVPLSSARRQARDVIRDNLASLEDAAPVHARNAPQELGKVFTKPGSRALDARRQVKPLLVRPHGRRYWAPRVDIGHERHEQIRREDRQRVCPKQAKGKLGLAASACPADEIEGPTHPRSIDTGFRLLPLGLGQFRLRVRIPTESGHLFRLNPGTRSDESGHPWKEALA